jgi:DNA-binding CsgD family transcriptional regulator
MHDGVDDCTAGHRAELESLSAREADVLQLLGEGLNNRDISKRLDITERTVKAHITSLLGKLRLESRLQAGLWAQRLGLGQFDRPGTNHNDCTNPHCRFWTVQGRSSRATGDVQRSNGHQYDHT